MDKMNERLILVLLVSILFCLNDGFNTIQESQEQIITIQESQEQIIQLIEANQ